MVWISVPPHSVYAATITVTTTVDETTTNGLCSLREALINANTDAATQPDCSAGTGADIITLTSGSTYNLSLVGNTATTGDLDITDVDGLTIQASGAAAAIIDANDIDRVIDVSAGDLILDTLTITNGTTTILSTDGGGIRFAGAGTLNITNSTISFNVSVGTGGCGGGIYKSSSATINITDSTITNNICTEPGASGGGLFNGTGGNVSIVNSTISNNSADGLGGGIRFNGSGTLSVTDSTISGNTSAGTGACGGGIYNSSDAIINITSSAIANNACTASGSDGGGVLKGTGGQLNIVNSTFYNNSTDDDGGALRVLAGTVNIQFSTFSNNSTSGGGGNTGGGIQIFGGTSNVTITSSIIANNSPDDCHQSGGPTIALNNDLIEMNTNCGTESFNTDPGLGAFQNNGGPTNTMAITNASVAYDAAAGCGGLTTDQRGITRPQGAACDLGAFELVVNTTTVGDGTSPADKFVTASDTNQAASAFTLSTNFGTDTVTEIIVTGTNITGNVAAGGAKLWLDNGTTPNEWDASDTQVGSGVSFAGSTATFSGLSVNVTTTSTQYLVTYDVSASPTNGQVMTGYVSGVTATNNVVNNDNDDASLTIDTAPPDTTILTNPANPSNTSAAVFTFSGNDGAGSGVASFECQMDGGGYSACTSGTDFGPLADGSHTFEVRAIDNLGQTDATPASYTWTIDTVAPDTSIDSNPTNPSNDTTPAFTFSGSDPGGSGIASFECQIDGGGYSACTSGSSFGPLADGSHTFEVRAIDNAGNTDPSPASYTWTIDTAAPDTSIDSNPANPSNTSAAVFTFSSPDGTATFECQINGGGYSACTSGTNFGPLADGSHTFEVRAVDTLGNTDATPASYTWTIDTTPPDTTILTNPTNPSNDTTPAFTFSGSDPGGSGIASFECQIDGGGYSACTSGSSFGPLADGSHTFEVRAIDNVGNTDPSPASYTWTIDTTLPDTSIDSTPADPSNNPNPVFTFSSPDATATFECQIDGGGYSACTSGSSFGPLADGSHTFEVRAVDPIGNTDPSPASYTWTIDATPPDTSIDSNPTDPSNDTTPPFTFSGSDPGGSGIASFECQIDGGGYSACTSGSSFGPLADGSHTFEVRAIDNAGNTDPSPASYTWTVDTGLPETTIDSTTPAGSPTNSTTMDITFSSNEAGTFQCRLDGGAYAPCTSPANLVGLGNGVHTFEVYATDTAGNDDPTPASYTWTVDLGFPTVLYNADTVPANNSTLTSGPTQIFIAFSEDVKNDGSAGAANDIANYLLVEAGTNTVFDTLSCIGGLVADDTLIAIDSATYTNNGGGGPFVATLGINGGAPLPVGTYRLFVCGTTSIEDLADNELNNGVNDSTLDFTVTVQRLSALPATGFPQGHETILSAQPSELTYSAYSDLWLEIPSLGVRTPIVGVPQTSDGWNVTWLNRDAGWLNGSAFPTWSGNSVITAHVWDAVNQPGPFAQLKNLKYGDQIKVHAFGQVYTYEIRGSTAVSPMSISTVFKHEEKSWITLVTCEGYDPLSGEYSFRRMVRAVLINITNE